MADELFKENLKDLITSDLYTLRSWWRGYFDSSHDIDLYLTKALEELEGYQIEKSPE